jgi:hypothetical protein
MGIMTNETWLYFHDWLDIPNGFEWNAIPIESPNVYAISYSLDTYRLLPKPYPTDCIDYHIRNEFLSQKDCIRKCLIKEGIDKCNAISNQTKIYEWEIRSLEGKYSNDNCSENLDINNKCNYFCRNIDCVKTFYKPYVIKSFPFDSKDAYISITTPVEPKRIHFYYAKIETIEFLCYLASILSLWFGFSFLSIYFCVEKLQTWFENKFKSKFHPLNVRIYVKKTNFSYRCRNKY